jgi:hypothetical protein
MVLENQAWAGSQARPDPATERKGVVEARFLLADSLGEPLQVRLALGVNARGIVSNDGKTIAQ